MPGGARTWSPCYPRLAVGRLVLLTDRPPAEALPSLHALGLDIKVEPLAPESLSHLSDITPSAVIVDAEENAEQGYRMLAALAAATRDVPLVALAARGDLDRFPWQDVADELLFSGATAQELRVRLGMLARRTGGLGEATVRLGPLSINTETYQVTVSGRVLDLTYKEFELLRFLVQRPGRVFTRSALLHEVWGYDFYGGTRTVDVHVRRLRAKLGTEHESLIETIRGVGYRAAEPASSGAGD
jgi:DNA-binding response OmpR family regulator